MTGTRALPIDGFAGLESRPGQKQPFTVNVGLGASGPTMPRGHTCTNTLDLPKYKSQAEMKQMLNMAIEYGNAGQFEDN